MLGVDREQPDFAHVPFGVERGSDGPHDAPVSGRDPDLLGVVGQRLFDRPLLLSSPVGVLPREDLLARCGSHGGEHGCPRTERATSTTSSLSAGRYRRISIRTFTTTVG